MKDYNEHQVVMELGRKADLRIQGRQIQHLNGTSSKGDVGIKSKGKIDFLVRYCGYSHYFVKSFN